MASAAQSSHPLSGMTSSLIPAATADSPLSDLPSDAPPAGAGPLSKLALNNAAFASVGAAAAAAAEDSDAGSMTLDPPPVAGGSSSSITNPSNNSAAPAPLTRVRKPKGNVKFSPAKGRSQTTGRRAAAAVAAGALANSGKAAPPSTFEDSGIPNNDYCETCGGKGHFLCCDGCPRSFHFSCLNPPLELDTIPADAWYCRACEAAKKPPPLQKGIFGPLIRRVSSENPSIFILPKEIKNSFRNVTTGANGEYFDTSEFRPLSLLGKPGKGGYEERDPFKQRDKAGRSVVCHRCREPASAPRQRRILACDFCELHWHLDCVDPPLVGMPPVTRRWKCPVHADHTMPAEKKLKHQRLIKVKDPYTKNNGDIEIIPSANGVGSAVHHRPEEVIRQGLRYQVPEQIVILDFWSKIRRNRYGQPLDFAKRPLTPSASTATFDFSDSSSLTSMEPSPERELGPAQAGQPLPPPDGGAEEAEADAAASGPSVAHAGTLDRFANQSQQSVQEQSTREGTEMSDGDPPDFMNWSEPDLSLRPEASPATRASSATASASASASVPGEPSVIPSTPQFSEGFQHLLSAAGLGPAQRARSVSPAHQVMSTSTPKREPRSRSSSFTRVAPSVEQTGPKTTALSSPTSGQENANGASVQPGHAADADVSMS